MGVASALASQPCGPVIDMAEDQIHPSGHFVDGLGIPTAVADLYQSGDARLKAVEGFVDVYLPSIFFMVGDDVMVTLTTTWCPVAF